jgi:hypothetical protein
LNRAEIIDNIYKCVKNDTYRLKNINIDDKIKMFGFDDYGYISRDMIDLKHDKIDIKIQTLRNTKLTQQEENEIKIVYHKAYENIISKKFAKDIISLKGYQLCPYCRAGYVSLIKINDKYIRPDLDHFYPKSKHYYLSITIDNLIPGCLLCNQRLKKDIDPSIDFKNTQEIFKKIKFEVDIINKYIYIINLDEFNKNEYEWIENMCISKIYSYHTEIFDNIYEKYEKYRKSNIKDMAKALNLDEEYIKNLIFCEFKIMKEKNEPLYKLKQDIFNQIMQI